MKSSILETMGKKQCSFQNPSCVSELQAALTSAIDMQPPCIAAGALTGAKLTGECNCTSYFLCTVPKSILGTSHHRHEDWFNNIAIHDLFALKNRAHNASIGKSYSSKSKEHFCKLCSKSKLLCDMWNKWWRNKFAEIQSYADANEFQKFYDSINIVYSPICVSAAPSTTLQKVVPSSEIAIEYWTNGQIIKGVAQRC